MKNRYFFIDNLRWVVVLLVLIYHVFYNFNAVGVFGGIGGFATEQWQDTSHQMVRIWHKKVVSGKRFFRGRRLCFGI